jgi:hypothetical protein
MRLTRKHTRSAISYRRQLNLYFYCRVTRLGAVPPPPHLYRFGTLNALYTFIHVLLE